MFSFQTIDSASRDGTLIRFWCRSETAPIVGYWSRTFIGWVVYQEPIPLIRHDVTGWEPIADQTAARAAPLEKVRRPDGATTVVVGTVKARVRGRQQPAGPADPAGRTDHLAMGRTDEDRRRLKGSGPDERLSTKICLII